MDTRAISSTIHSLRTRLAAIVVLLMVVVVYLAVAATIPSQRPQAPTESSVRVVVAESDLAAYERTLARLRDLNTSGDPALDAGLLLLPEHMPGQRSGPY